MAKPRFTDNPASTIDRAVMVEEQIAALSQALSAAGERMGRLEDLVMSLEERVAHQISEALRAGEPTRQPGWVCSL